MAKNRSGKKSDLTRRIADRMEMWEFISLLNVLPNPDEIPSRLGREIDLYKEVLKDPFVGACVLSLKVGVQRLEWDVNEGDLRKEEKAKIAKEERLKAKEDKKVENQERLKTLAEANARHAEEKKMLMAQGGGKASFAEKPTVSGEEPAEPVEETPTNEEAENLEKQSIAVDAEVDEHLEIVRTALKRLFQTGGDNGWHRIIDGILTSFLFGYSPIEVIWEVNENMMLPKVIEAKPPQWFYFSTENALLLRTREYPMGTEVPPYKFLVPSYDSSYENPYGSGVLSRAYWSATFRKTSLKLMVRFGEKYGIPYLHAKHNLIKPADIDVLRDELDDLKEDGVAVTKNDVDIAFLTAGAQSTSIYAEMIQIFRDEISAAILGHTAGAQSTAGRLGNENMAMVVREDVIEAGKRLCEEFVNKLIRWMYELNKWDASDPVVFRMFPPQDVDMAQAQRDQILYALGVRFTPEYIERVYNIPTEDFELQAMPTPEELAMAQGGGGNDPNAPEGGKPPFGKKKSEEETGDEPVPEEGGEAGGTPTSFADPIPVSAQSTVDDLADSLAMQGQDVIESLMEKVVSYLQGAESYEDAVKGLTALYDKMDADALEDLFLRALTSASVAGRRMKITPDDDEEA